MISKLKRQDHLRILVYVLLMALCVTLLPITVMGDENKAAANDVTQNVTIGDVNVTYYDGGSWKTYMTGGAVKESEREKIFEKGTTMRFYVKWSVSDVNIKQINENDFFHVSIPITYFEFSNMGPVDIRDSNGRLIGEYTVSNQKMKVVFSDIVDQPNVTEIKDGWLMAKGSLNSSQIPGNTISIGGIDIPITATGSSITESGEPKGALKPSKEGSTNSLIKKGQTNKSTQTINWYINVNDDMYRAKYNGLQTYSEKKNLVIEDKLENGQTFKNIQFYHKYHYAYEDDDGSLNMASEYFDVYYDTDQTFTKLTQNSNESYDDFKDRVIEKGKTGNKPAYGVWSDQNIVISLGDMPDKLKMPLTYDELVSKMAVNKYNNMDIPDKVQSNTSNAYSDKFYMNNTASAYALNFKIESTINGNSRKVDNQVTMLWDDNNLTTTGAFVNFEAIAGGAELGKAGSVTIRKYDADTQSMLDGIKFKLQKKNLSGDYEDYTPNTGSIIRSTSGGSIVYYDLNYGDYKVVEVETLPGYSSKISFAKGDGTFTVDGTESGTIYVDAYNYKEGVKGQTDNPGSDVDTPSVKGQKETPEVLGKEARTADISNITPLLVIMLIITILLLAVSLQYSLRKNQ